MNCLLIVTNKEDTHADSLIRRSNELLPGWSVVRLHPEDMAENLAIELIYNEFGKENIVSASIIDSGREFRNTSVIWWRKPFFPNPHSALSSSIEKECSETEYKSLLFSIYGFFPNAKWVNDYWNMRRYSYKLNQIQIFRKNNLRIPRTIVTSSVRAIKEFASKISGEMIIKPISYDGFMKNGKPYACWTNIVDIDYFENITDEELKYAPFFLQERIFKKMECRVTIIGDEVYSCKIATKKDSVENIDWRSGEIYDLPHEIIDLDKELEQKLIKSNKDMGLNYGAYDLIEDEKGNHYILEINPNGQYLWIENITRAPLTEAMCRLITKLAS